MRGCWVASQYGPHLLVPLTHLGHIEKQPSILACQLIFFIIYTSRVPLGYIFAIYVHPSVDIQQCISNTYNFKHLNLKKRISQLICVSQIIPHSTMKLRLKFTLLLSSRGTRYRGGSLHLQSLVISSVEPLLTFTLLYHWHRQIDTYNHEDNPHSGDFYSFYSINVCRRHLEVMETHGEKTVRIYKRLNFFTDLVPDPTWISTRTTIIIQN